MVNMQPLPIKPSNKVFWIFISIGALIVAAAVTVGLLLAGSNPNPTGNGEEDPAQSEAYGISETPPAITGIEASMEGETVTFAVTTEDYNSSKLFLEYELADQNRTVVEKGFERSNMFNVSTNVSDSAYFRMKVRLSDKEISSGWSDSFTVQLEDVSGVSILQPNEAYYVTAWAQGEGSPENLVAALTIAYQAEPLAYVECLPLNTGTMTPTLLLPPIPSVSPSNAILSYTVNSYSANHEASITYYWC